MENNRKKIKYSILLSFIVCMFFLVGCSNSSDNTFKTLTSTMTKIEQTIDKVQVIDNSELIIDDFMDENDMDIINTNPEYLIGENDSINSYVAKITALNNNIYSTILVNDQLAELKRQILSKTSQIKVLTHECNLDNKEFSKQNSEAIKEITSNLMENNTRVSLTRNEINNYFISVKNLQDKYSNKTSQLNTRYSKLQGALNTRCSYYYNILNGLEEISILLCSDCNYENDKYLINKESNEEEKTEKTGLTKNIDSYDNAGTNLMGLPNNRLNRSLNNGYGYYGNYNGNGYGYGGYGMGGYGNMYGYGMGMPWGYGMPNINTYGGIRNIDTYRSRKANTEAPEGIYEYNYEDEQNKLNEVFKFKKNIDTYKQHDDSQNREQKMTPKRPPIKQPRAYGRYEYYQSPKQETNKQENKLKENIEESINQEDINNEELLEQNVSDVFNPNKKLRPTPMEKTSQNDDGEDTFVDNMHKPKIEKISE